MCVLDHFSVGILGLEMEALTHQETQVLTMYVTLHSLSEQLFDSTVHYRRHREYFYAMVNVTQFSPPS